MGVAVPQYIAGPGENRRDEQKASHTPAQKELKPIPYSLSETTVSFDEAVHAWKTARELIITHAVLENTIFRLDLHIRKTQKRASALENITIPMYIARIKYIQERLEERERDELARLKLVKKHAEK